MGTLLSVLHLTRKEYPVYSELMPSKQIIGQTVIYTMDLSALQIKGFRNVSYSGPWEQRLSKHKTLSFGLFLGLVLIFTCHLNCSSLVTIVGM